MKVLIVDDNPLARITLKELVGNIADLELMGTCESAKEAFNVIQDNRIDLILLDIEMPDLSGIDLLKNLVSQRPLIIFVTAKKDYALDAFDLNVVDYLVKPILPSRFKQAIDKAREILSHKNEIIKSNPEEFLFVRDSYVVRRLKIEDILYAEAMGDYVKIFTSNKVYAIHSTLKAIEERLPTQSFIRVHRSYIVAIDKIDIIQDRAIVINKKLIPIADSYRASFNKRINIL